MPKPTTHHGDVTNEGKTTHKGPVHNDHVGAGMAWQASGTYQDIPHDTVTKVAWSRVLFEDTDVADADQTNDRITVQEDGRYEVAVTLYWTQGADWTTGDSIRIEVYINGTYTDTDFPNKVGTGGETMYFNPRQYDLSAGDYVEIKVQQMSGVKQNLNQGSSAADKQANFTVTKVA